MKILNIKKTAILSLALMIGSANAGILNSISKKVSNAGNTVEQKFDLKKKYEKTKAFVKKHKKAVIGGTILAGVIIAGAIYKYIQNKSYLDMEKAKAIQQRILDNARRLTPAQQAMLNNVNGTITDTTCAFCKDPDDVTPTTLLTCGCMSYWHKTCVGTWLNSHRTCPGCRQTTPSPFYF